MGYSGNLYAQATEVITSQGDLRRGDSSGNPERLAIGSSGKVLQSNGTTESWETLAAGGATIDRNSVTLSSEVSSTSTSMVTITGLTFTLGNNGSGSAYTVMFNGNAWIDNATLTVTFQLLDGSTNIGRVGKAIFHNGTPDLVNFYGQGDDNSTNTLALQWALSGSDAMYTSGASSPSVRSTIYLMEIY